MGRFLKKARQRNHEKKQKKEQRKETKKQKKIAHLEGQPKKKPQTIDSLRVKDETIITDLESEENREIKEDIENDEFQNYFEKSYIPKVLITTSDNAGSKTRSFCKELSRVIPNATARCRYRMGVKSMVKAAIKHEFSDIVIINEDHKMPNALLLIHLPDGPTAHFKLTNVRVSKELRKDYKEMTEHRPEVILNNFSTRLGYSISRMLACLFHYEPQFKGRRCVTFHNQRDFIFFRHHRYVFANNGKKVKLMELGPRFTLKLRSLQHGTFDTKTGEYEWIIQGRRHEMETNRRKFFL